MDESPFNLHMLRTHGRALRGVTPNPIVQNSRGPNITMILAVSGKGVVHCEANFRSVNTDTFQEYLKRIHTIVGHGDSIIVMDNVRFHHANQEFYDNFALEVHYLPTYSPFLNPCEEVFSCIKARIRRDGPLNGRSDLIERMVQASNSITEEEATKFFQHSESFIGKCHRMEDITRD